VRALLSFFTALPVRDSSLEEAAQRAYLLPLVGLFTGVPGAVLILLAHAVPPGVAATLALGAVLLAAGLHHTDGVLDAGDALMVRGTQERRRAVLKDARVGVGGIAALFVVYAPALAALAALAGGSPTRAALALLAGEVSTRSTMLLILTFGKPAEAGSSSVPFVRALKGPRRVVGVSLALVGPLPFLLPLGDLAPLAALSVPLTALIVLRAARRAFGGIGGDVIGAAGEVTRTALLVALSAT
jgi:adenosylcobinamide-GDP ribazoletransferase